MSSLFKRLFADAQQLIGESEEEFDKATPKERIGALVIAIFLLIVVFAVVAVFIKAFFWPLVIATLAYYAVRMYLK